jgi:hypothetical protein
LSIHLKRLFLEECYILYRKSAIHFDEYFTRPVVNHFPGKNMGIVVDYLLKRAMAEHLKPIY